MNKLTNIAYLTIIILAVIILTAVSCTDSRRAKLGGYGSEYRIELYSGGIKVREWVSSGKVHSENGSDGYYFNDKNANTLIEVSGTVVITKL